MDRTTADLSHRHSTNFGHKNIRIGTLSKVLHSFALHFSLKDWLSKTPGWLSVEQVSSYIEGVKGVAFARAHEQSRARQGIERVFNGLLDPEFSEGEWAERTGFSNGQSLGMSKIEGVEVGKFVEVMEGFYAKFGQVCKGG